MSVFLSYTRRGSGEPLVLLHGIGHRLEAFDPIVDRLAKHFDVIAVDMPGFGNSPGFTKPTDYGITALANAVAENFAVWGIEKPHVVGNSLGGAVSVALAQQGKVRSATTLSPAGWFFPWSLIFAGLPLLFMKLGSFAPTPILRVMARSKFGRKIMGFSLYKYPERNTPDGTFGDAIAMRKAPGFWPMFLACIPLGFRVPVIFRGPARVPLTIAWGEHDLLLSPSQASLAARSMSGINFVLLSDAGHVPMGDNPDQVIEAILETTARAATPDRVVPTVA